MFYELLFKLLKVALGTTLTMIVGSIWYSDNLFRKQWMECCGVTEDQVRRQQKMATSLLIEFLARLSRTVVFFFIASNFDKNFSTAFQLSCWIFLGFIVPQVATKVAWELKNWDYFIINASEGFLCLIVLSFISTL